MIKWIVIAGGRNYTNYTEGDCFTINPLFKPQFIVLVFSIYKIKNRPFYLKRSALTIILIYLISCSKSSKRLELKNSFISIFIPSLF